MALVLLDRAKETTTVVGTGTATLLGAVTSYQSLAGVGNGNTTYYCIVDQVGANWEVGIGTYSSSGTTLARTTVLASSNAGALVVFTTGVKDVFVTYPSEKGVWLDASNNAIGLGTPAAFVGTNITGTASGLTAGNVTTNANLTGAVTSTGNATSLGSFTSLQLATALTDETGSGSAVFATSPTLANPTYTGTLTGSTGILNIGSGQLYKDASGNVGIGTSSPGYKLDVVGATGNSIRAKSNSGSTGNYAQLILDSYNSFSGTGQAYIRGVSSASGNSNTDLAFGVNASGFGSPYEAMRIDSSGNVGIGVTPSAWKSTVKVIEFQNGVSLSSYSAAPIMQLGTNWYDNGTNNLYKTSAAATSYQQSFGAHYWYNAPSGTAGNAISFTQAMILDASGNLLVGTTSNVPSFGGTARFRAYGGVSTVATGGSNDNSVAFVVESPGNSPPFQVFTSANGSVNAAASCVKIQNNGSTSRSISAGGTINASGADYAEYMTKSGDFTVAKGDVVGIDVEGKLTNVFVDAISFVVKSTDPSYVGGDTWGSGFEDDAEGLEVARQTVDRIAFAGQVPVNVLGATAGQYIIPINDKGTIKGEAVSSPTFEQYQIAVGKVIAIEADGCARIIVKVA